MADPGEARTGLDERKAGVRRTFDAVAATYLEGPARRWEPIAQRLVARLAPQPGDAVLDAACGAGSSVLPAAEAVGDSGSVLGIDLSEEMLALARTRVAESGFDHVELRTGDLEAIDISDDAFDVVQCSLGVFFVADIPAALAELWRVLKPGGRLGLTAWGEGAFEPLRSLLWDAMREDNPSFQPTTPPYLAVATPERWAKRFAEAGLPTPEVTVDADSIRASKPEDAWTLAVGGGCRAALDSLDDAARHRVQQAFLERAAAEPELVADMTVLYAVAAKR